MLSKAAEASIEPSNNIVGHRSSGWPAADLLVSSNTLQAQNIRTGEHLLAQSRPALCIEVA